MSIPHTYFLVAGPSVAHFKPSASYLNIRLSDWRRPKPRHTAVRPSSSERTPTPRSCRQRCKPARRCAPFRTVPCIESTRPSSSTKPIDRVMLLPPPNYSRPGHTCGCVAGFFPSLCRPSPNSKLRWKTTPKRRSQGFLPPKEPNSGVQPAPVSK